MLVHMCTCLCMVVCVYFCICVYACEPVYLFFLQRNEAYSFICKNKTDLDMFFFSVRGQIIFQPNKVKEGM